MSAPRACRVWISMAVCMVMCRRPPVTLRPLRGLLGPYFLMHSIRPETSRRKAAFLFCRNPPGHVGNLVRKAQIKSFGHDVSYPLKYFECVDDRAGDVARPPHERGGWLASAVRSSRVRPRSTGCRVQTGVLKPTVMRSAVRLSSSAQASGRHSGCAWFRRYGAESPPQKDGRRAP